MKHAGPGALDQLEPLLAQLRGLGGGIDEFALQILQRCIGKAKLFLRLGAHRGVITALLRLSSITGQHCASSL